MKKVSKQLITASVMGLLLFGFSSCSHEDVREPSEQSQMVSPSLDGITFTLHFAGQEPKTVNTRAAVHDSKEWTIDQLQIFVFDKAGKYITKKKIKGTQLSHGSDAKYTYNPNGLAVDNNKVLQFFFLANGENIDLSTGANLTMLKDKVFGSKQTAEATSILTAKEGGTGEYCIPMTGMATIETGNTLIPYTRGIQATVQLIRTVARIDLVNRIPELIITDISLHNAFENSRVGESQAETARFNGFVKPFNPIFGGLSGDRDNGNKHPKSFYLYEGKNQEDKCVYVQLKGTLSGIPRTYNIPFRKKTLNMIEPSEVVDVKRNHLYTIVLGGITAKNQVMFSFAAEEWGVRTFYEPFTPIKAEAKDSNTTYERTGVDTGKVTIKKTGGKAELNLSSIIVGHIKFNDSAVIEGAANSWITSASIAGDVLTIAVTSNNGTEAREGTVIITSNTGEKLTITVLQEA